MTLEQVQNEMSMQDMVKTAFKSGFKPSSAAYSETNPQAAVPSRLEQEAYNFLLMVCDSNEDE